MMAFFTPNSENNTSARSTSFQLPAEKTRGKSPARTKASKDKLVPPDMPRGAAWAYHSASRWVWRNNAVAPMSELG